MADFMKLPEDWERTLADYSRAAGEAGPKSLNPSHPTAQKQAQRLAQRRADDEARVREMMGVTNDS